MQTVQYKKTSAKSFHSKKDQSLYIDEQKASSSGDILPQKFPAKFVTPLNKILDEIEKLITFSSACIFAYNEFENRLFLVAEKGLSAKVCFE